VIERLRRALVMIGIARNGMPQTDPSQTFTGPMVTLINEFSASDGDIFPYRFKVAWTRQTHRQTDLGAA
jgi:tricorn protease